MKQKCLLIAVMLMIFSMVTVAQTEKGKIIVSGSSRLNFSSESSKVEVDGEQMGEKEKTTEFGLNPMVGYFFMDNLAVGLSLDFTTGKYDEEKITSLLIGPAARYYFLEDKIRPFVQAEVLIGSEKWDDSKYNSFSYGAGGGVAFFLNEFISLDLGLNVVQCTEKDKDDGEMGDFKYKTTGVYFEGGFSIFF